jgi:hypothetical protein
MKIDDIREIINKDTTFIKEDCNIDIASLSVPEMCSKYQNLIYDEHMSLRFFQKEYDIVRTQRWIYYTGKADPEEYQKEPFNLKILKADVEMFLRSDERLNLVKDKVKAQEQKLHLLTEFSKSIMSMSFNIGNTIKWRKFLNGEIG